MRKALWVVRDRITTAKAIDDLLADATTRGIFDVVVQVRTERVELPIDRLRNIEPGVGALLPEQVDPLDLVRAQSRPLEMRERHRVPCRRIHRIDGGEARHPMV